MTTVATLMVRLDGDEKPLLKSMKSAERAATGMATKMKRVSKDVGSAFGRMAKSVNLFKVGLVAVAGAAALGLLVKKTLATADAIAKTADKIGISTDALQEFRFAAGIAGVSIGMMDNSLAKFSKNMGELGLSSSTTQTALKDLDKTLLADLKSTSDFDKQLGLAFEALANVEDHAKRAAIAVALFGRSGQGLLNLVGHVERLRQVAKDMKIVWPEHLLRDAERANDQMSMLAQILGAKLSVAILKNADAIAAFSERLINAIPGIVRGTEAFLRFIGVSEETEAVKAGQELAVVAERIGEVGSQILALQTGGMALGMSKLLKGAEAQALMAGLKKEMVDLKARHAELMEQIAKPVKLKPITKTQNVPVIESAPFFDDRPGIFTRTLRQGVLEARESIERLKASMTATGAALTKEMLTPTEKYAARIRELNALVEAGAVGNETYTRAVIRAQEEMATAADATNQLTAAQERLASVADSTFDRIIAGASSASEILRTLAIDMIKALALNFSGGQSLGQLLVGGLSGMFDDKKIPGLAAGGAVSSNRPYIVGERGPELMVPGSSGAIVPNHKLGGGTGGGITNVFNISTGVAPTVRSEIMNLLPVITAKVKQSIASDQTRGGDNSFARR